MSSHGFVFCINLEYLGLHYKAEWHLMYPFHAKTKFVKCIDGILSCYVPLPIRRIAFTTPKEEREKLVER